MEVVVSEAELVTAITSAAAATVDLLLAVAGVLALLD